MRQSPASTTAAPASSTADRPRRARPMRLRCRGPAWAHPGCNRTHEVKPHQLRPHAEPRELRDEHDVKQRGDPGAAVPPLSPQRKKGPWRSFRCPCERGLSLWTAMKEGPKRLRHRGGRWSHVSPTCCESLDVPYVKRLRGGLKDRQRLVNATCQPLQWSRSSAENSSRRARPPDYDESSARRDHQASAAVIALSASWMASPTSPAVAAQCKGTRARAPGSQRCSSRVSGSGAVPS